jgi:hypothetical protein
LERGWTKIPCHPAGHQHGSLCSIPAIPTSSASALEREGEGERGGGEKEGGIEADIFFNITSNNTASNKTYLVGYILSQEYSQVLPCALFNPYTPSITSNGSILPEAYNAFLEDESSMCAGSESLSPRIVVPAPQGHMYDITQCDLHDSGLTMVYVKSEQSIYLSSKMEVTGVAYWFSGLCIIVLMACLSQEIVSLLNRSKKQKAARGDVCLGACIAALVLSLSTGGGGVGGVGSSGLQVFLTLEETVAFWWMVIYCSMRIVWILWLSFQSAFSLSTSHSSSSSDSEKGLPVWKMMHKAIMHETYYNLLVTSMMLLASRVHMTVDTPYTIGLSLLLGIRMFLKVYEGYDFDESSFSSGAAVGGVVAALAAATTAAAAAESSSMRRVFRQVVVLGDSVLMMVMLQAGGITQFENVVDAQACVIVLVFACICIARGVYEYNVKFAG